MAKDNLKWLGSIINTLAIVFPRLVAKFILFKFSRPLARKGFDQKNQRYLQDSGNVQYVRIKDTKIATYHWKGTGSKILLCHGWESNSSRWQSLIKVLMQHNFDIYAFDAPAHGFSGGKSITPIEFISVIEYLDTQHDFFAIVGHSYGGFNALFYAKDHPNSFQKIIALAPTNSIADVVTGMQARMGFSDRVIRFFNKVFKAKFGQAPSAFQSKDFVRDLLAKGLIIHDEGDAVLPFSGSAEIHEYWQGSELNKTSGFGHRLKSKKVNELIVSFLLK